MFLWKIHYDFIASIGKNVLSLLSREKDTHHKGLKNMLTHSQKQGLVMIAVVVGLMTLPIIY